MNVTIQPGPRQGRVRIPASKSQAHRLLLCAALGEGETELLCGGLSADIRATMDCLRALGAAGRPPGARPPVPHGAPQRRAPPRGERVHLALPPAPGGRPGDGSRFPPEGAAPPAAPPPSG